MVPQARPLVRAFAVAVLLSACTAPVYAPGQPRVMVPAPAHGQPAAPAPAPQTPPAGGVPEAPTPPAEVMPVPPLPPPPGSGATAALLTQSREQSAQGNYAMATSSLERALRINPKDPALWLELGRVKLRQNDFAQAESMARRASAVAGTDPRWRGEIDELMDAARRGEGR